MLNFFNKLNTNSKNIDFTIKFKNFFKRYVFDTSNIFYKKKTKIIKNINNSLQNNFKTKSVENTTPLNIFFNIKNLFNYCHNVTLVNFFRKNKVYIKSKFSKIRAFNKTIVLFSLCLNVIFIIELHSLYYNITLNYGYFIYYIYIVISLVSIKYIIKYQIVNVFYNNIICFFKNLKFINFFFKTICYYFFKILKL